MIGSPTNTQCIAQDNLNNMPNCISVNSGKCVGGGQIKAKNIKFHVFVTIPESDARDSS